MLRKTLLTSEKIEVCILIQKILCYFQNEIEEGGSDASFNLSPSREIVTLIYKRFMKACCIVNMHLVNWVCVVTSVTYSVC